MRGSLQMLSITGVGVVVVKYPSFSWQAISMILPGRMTLSQIKDLILRGNFGKRVKVIDEELDEELETADGIYNSLYGWRPDAKVLEL